MHNPSIRCSVPSGGGEDARRASGERLDSWKEIASYFRREVRTVQLWEKNEGLPIRRQYHKKLGSVYAYRHELEAWWTARSAIHTGQGNGLELSSSADKREQGRASLEGSSVGALRILALPFEFIRSAQDLEATQGFVHAFASGLRNDLIVELTRSKFHPVILPIDAVPSQATSALDWGKEIATELEVDAVLMGSIRHSGNELRISMQMVRASDSRCLWSDRFDARLDGHFDAQAELALRITQALPDCQVHCMSARQRGTKANSGLAMHACSLGFHSWQQRKADSLRRAVNYFSDAIELDPFYADAYAGLADTYISLSYGHMMPPQQAASSALKAIQSALKLNDHSIRVNNAYINWLIHCSWNLPAAEKLCRKMIDSGQMDARTIQLYSSIMILRDRHQDSIRLALQACQLAPEPDQINLNGQVALAYFYSADYRQAISSIRRIIDLQPQYMMGYVLLGRAESQLGNWDKAISAFTKGVELSQGSPFNRALLASAYAGSKEVSKAHAILNKLSAEEDSDNFPAFDISAAYAVLQQEKEALQNIRRAIDRRDMMTVFVGQDPRFSRLRSSAGYRQIISNISPKMISSATI